MTELTLRPVDRARDRAFLLAVYADTRHDVAALLDWTDEQKQAFVEQQFDAQDRYYHEQFPDASFDVIVRGVEEVGRLYVDRRDDEIRIIDIALRATARRAGIGRRLMQALLDEAAARGVPVRIHVERGNPALRLYEALGFRVIGEVGIYWFMEWAAI